MEHGYHALAQALHAGKTIWRVTPLTESALGRATQSETRPDWLGHGQTAPCVCESPDGTALVECLRREKTLLICGGGHVSVPVARLGGLLGYTVLVVDDRPEFADPARFPDAARVVCAPFDTFLNERFDWDAHPDLSVVIVTRGHAADAICLRAAVGRPLTYLGMIGSARKNRAIFDLLRAEGVAQDALDRVHAPIGLAIGAETPEEIAVAIAAEWIAARGDGRGAMLPPEIVGALAQGAGGLMLTVVRKTGSAPRGLGARLLLLPDGQTLGTIGGGLAEYEAVCFGRELLQNPHPTLRTFDMKSGEAGKSGMICGGEIDVLYEVVT